MVKKFLFVVLSGAALCVNGLAQENAVYDPRLAGSPLYSDPVYQDFVETSYGYLNPNNIIKVRGDFRDALSPLDAPSLKETRPFFLPSPKNLQGKPRYDVPLAAAGDKGPRQAGGAAAKNEGEGLPVLPADYYKVTFAGDNGPIASFVKPLGRASVSPREYVFVSVLPKERNYDGMLKEIAVSAGFRFSGEKTLYFKGAKRTIVLGWAQSARLDSIYRNPKVAGVSVEKKSSGIPLKTRVKFTLKVPYQNRPAAFVSRFVKDLGSDRGFVSENIFRLPSSGDSSKFTAFDITGSIYIDSVGELARSPFVVAVESTL